MKNYETDADFHVDLEQDSYFSGWALSESGFNCGVMPFDKVPVNSTWIKVPEEVMGLFKLVQKNEEDLWIVYTPAQEIVKEFSTIVMQLGHTKPDLDIGSGYIGQNKDGTYVVFIPVQESIKELEVLKKSSKKLDLHFERRIGLNDKGFFDTQTGESLFGKVCGKYS